MRTILVALVLGFILLCLPLPNQAQILGPWDVNAIEQPDSMIFVGGATGGTLAEGISACPAGGTIYVWPGVYSSGDVAINDTITLCGTVPLRYEDNLLLAEQRWITTGEHWRINAGGYLRLKNLYIQTTGADSLARCNDRSWEAESCVFDGTIFVHTGDTTGIGNQGNNRTRFYDCTFLNRGFSTAGMFQTSDTSVFINTTYGRVLMEAENGFYGPYVANGIQHFRGKTNIYSDSIAILTANAGVAIFYEPVIMGVMGAKDCPAVYAIGNSGITIYGGEVVNNDSDKTTIMVANAANVHIEKTTIKNKYSPTTNNTAGGVYSSTSSAASTLWDNVYGGAITAWNASDAINFQSLWWDDDDVATNDVGFALENLSGKTLILEALTAVSSAEGDSITLQEKNATGGNLATIEILGCNTVGTNSYYATAVKYGDIDDHEIAAGSQIWINHNDISTNPSGFLGVRIYYIISVKNTAQ